jgi:hypothetical protein
MWYTIIVISVIIILDMLYVFYGDIKYLKFTQYKFCKKCNTTTLHLFPISFGLKYNNCCQCNSFYIGHKR